ncbi:MAG: hypothetical protein KGJ98_00645 [Chloroflexota bacterium]|nr:hypothetical protein [Chloroflexota bacterium]
MSRLKAREADLANEQDPALRGIYMWWSGTVYSEMSLTPRLAELVRLRSAFHAQCSHCMYHRFTDVSETGIDEDLVCSLEKPEEAPGLSVAERVALRYTDLICPNRHLEQDDAIFADLRAHYSEREIVELGLLLMDVHARQRMRSILREDVEHLPEQFQAKAGEIHFAGVGEFVNTPDKRGQPWEPTYRQVVGRPVRPSAEAPRGTHARITPLRREDFDRAYRACTAHIPDHDLGTRRILAHSPVAATAWERYVTTIRERSRLPLRTLELIRLRIAFTNRSANDMALRDDRAGLDEEVVRSLEKPSTATCLSAAERLALGYADLITGDHFAITERTFEELRGHFSEVQIAELGPYITAQMVAGRVALGWRYTDDLPEPYRNAVPEDLHFRPDAVVSMPPLSRDVAVTAAD